MGAGAERVTLPRMNSNVTRNVLVDELTLAWNGKTYLTTGAPGSFTRRVINEHKRRFAHVPKEKKQ